MVPLLVWLVLERQFVPAFWLFLATGMTDALDGFLARRLDAITRLGQILDPLADKLLINGVVAAGWWVDVIPTWLLVVFFGRDFFMLVGAAVSWRYRQRAKMLPNVFGKANTALQVTYIALILLTNAYFAPVPEAVQKIESAIGLLIAISTIASGLVYLKRAYFWLKTEQTD